MKITFLKPAGLTFTSIAYDSLARAFGAPPTTGAELVLADKNESVLATLLSHDGYGAIAMETKAEGRVDPPINSFIELLKRYERSDCPIQVIGALRMKINFALMVRRGVSLSEITRVVTHKKSIGACRGNIAKLGVPTEEVGSNGLAAELVARNDEYALSAALAPREAAEALGLEIPNPAFEDREAVTTFYLLGPRNHPKPQEVPTRTLIVFRLAHSPGTLVYSLYPFRTARINLRMIHSLPIENEEQYDFAVELEQNSDSASFDDAFHTSKKHMGRHILFGPFPVISG